MGYFCLIGIFLIYIDFCFVRGGFVCVSCFCCSDFVFVCLFERKRKNKVGWVEKWEGSGRNWGRRKTYMKKIFNKIAFKIMSLPQK